MNLIREVCRQQYEQMHSIFYWQSQNERFACIRSLFNGLETSLWAASERFWVFSALLVSNPFSVVREGFATTRQQCPAKGELDWAQRETAYLEHVARKGQRRSHNPTFVETSRDGEKHVDSVRLFDGCWVVWALSIGVVKF